MKREELKNILASVNPTDEMIDKIMSLAGNDINAMKNDNEALKKQISDRDKDIEELKKNSGDINAINEKLSELQKKYDDDTKAYAEQIAARDYTDAAKTMISKNKIKFSSKAAESFYMTRLREKALKVENGELIGFEDFHKGEYEADKAAFIVEETPTENNGGNNQQIGGMRFSTPAGNNPQQITSTAAQAAARFNKMHGAAKAVTNNT